jgi:hypothetical protein
MVFRQSAVYRAQRQVLAEPTCYSSILSGLPSRQQTGRSVVLAAVTTKNTVFWMSQNIRGLNLAVVKLTTVLK